MTQVENVDVLIVGSGPSGMSTALHLVQSDPTWAERLVVVDKAVHPREKLCGGGVTHLGTDVLARLGLRFEPQHFKVREVRLVYEDKSYSFQANPAFRITRRDEFDHWLVRQGEARGIRVRQGEAVKKIAVHDEYVEVVTEKAVFHAAVVVGADGSRSFVRSRLKWDDESRVARLLEVLTPEDAQRQMEFREGVAVFDFTPMKNDLQGYYWDFPSYVKGKPYMNRGVFDSRARPEKEKAKLPQVLDDAMAERGRRLEEYKLKGHPIRWFDKDGQFAQERVLLVGDAAGADPLFGEGISFALGYGEVAAETINEAFARQDFSFADYRRRLLEHRLFDHLAWRTRLARYAYLLNYPWLVRLGWRVARLLVRFSRWRDRDYVPGEAPELLLDTSASGAD
ncbi:MAG TPA: FAD-dependent monooxygenase [Candidatus Sulfomarinibacteraceae bacterium]|nr:FAD-dependent monooxygenase [Candidatus Sulfomarinibacteraceae bacterium]